MFWCLLRKGLENTGRKKQELERVGTSNGNRDGVIFL